MRIKTVEAAKSFRKMILKIKHWKVWSDKGTDFKGVFLRPSQNKNIGTYTIHSEDKLASVEKNFRSAKTPSI